MKDQWAAKHVLDMDTQWKDAIKRYRRVQSAAAKDTFKISKPSQKSDAATVEMTTKRSQETAPYSKEKQKSSRSKQKNAYPTTGHSKTSQNKPTSWIIFFKRSKEHL